MLRTLVKIAKGVLLILAISIFTFALLSGAESNDLQGILNNAPNAIPWLVLFAIVWLAFKRELIGGVVLLLFSILAFFFFSMSLFVLLWISIPIAVIAIILILYSKIK